MAPAVVARKTPPALSILIAVVAALGLVAFLFFLNRPVAQPAGSAAASAEAKAYLSNLALNDVTMQATENFMQQQVVEVQGNITNKGARKLASISVYCLFSGLNGAEIHRERLAIVRSGNGLAPMAPGETRSFRLPFDQLPEGWNQSMPRLVIAQITFAE